MVIYKIHILMFYQNLHIKMKKLSLFQKSFYLSVVLVLLIGCTSKMSTYLGKNPERENNYDGCLGASAVNIVNQPALNTIRRWAESPEQAEMIDNFVSISAQYTLIQFKVNPYLSYYDDGNEPNAFAYYAGSGDGIVRLGGKLVQNEFRLWRRDFLEQCRRLGKDPNKLLQERKAGGAYAINAIIAHEAAHILQAKMGVAFNSRNTELQADFLAGWHMAEWVRIFKTEAKEFRMKEDGIRAFYSRGDYSFNSPQHHGTPDQRAKAFSEGFNLGDVDLVEAWNESMKFRRKLGG